MKLYFAPTTCSLSPHIVLRELGMDFELIRVDNQSKRTADGQDFRDINPKGYVAALVLDNTEVLTEGPAILQYLVDLKPEAGLAPVAGSLQRVRFNEWLNFIATEIHSGSAPLFNSAMADSAKAIFRQRLCKRLDYLSEHIGQHGYLLGVFSAIDAYLFAVLLWLPAFNIDINHWLSLADYQSSVGKRKAVIAAIAAEEGSAAVAC